MKSDRRKFYENLIIGTGITIFCFLGSTTAGIIAACFFGYIDYDSYMEMTVVGDRKREELQRDLDEIKRLLKEREERDIKNNIPLETRVHNQEFIVDCIVGRAIDTFHAWGEAKEKNKVRSMEYAFSEMKINLFEKPYTDMQFIDAIAKEYPGSLVRIMLKYDMTYDPIEKSITYHKIGVDGRYPKLNCDGTFSRV